LVGKHLGEPVGSSDYDVRAFGYNLNISRNIERVGYTGSGFSPMSYEQVGGFTVTGDVTFKRDINFTHINDYFNNDAMSGFKFTNGSGYEVFLNGIVSDVSNDTGSPELRNTVSFQGAGNPKINNDGTTLAWANSTYDAGVNTTCTSVGNGLSNGQRVTVTGVGSHNGTYYIEEVTDNTFDIVDVYTGSPSGGSWALTAESLAIVSIDL